MTTIDDITIKQAEMKKFENELKILINQRLYDKGHITSEMYSKAKAMILKSA